MKIYYGDNLLYQSQRNWSSRERKSYIKDIRCWLLHICVFFYFAYRRRTGVYQVVSAFKIWERELRSLAKHWMVVT